MSTTAVVGSRSFNNYALVKSILDSVKPDEIVSGGAFGADILARRYAEEKTIPIREFLPDYDLYNTIAPIFRNKQIVNSSDRVIAFWDGSSKGTKFTIDYARKQNKPVILIDVSKCITRSDIIGEPSDRLDAWSRYLDCQRAVSGSAARLKSEKFTAALIKDLDKRYVFSQKYVDFIFNTHKYLPLKNKDNVYLVMPSSSGNKFPLALATQLKQNFGGEIITDFAEQTHLGEIKKLSGIRKVFTNRSYSLKNHFINSIESIKSKNIVVVDDLISTGITVDSLRSELNKTGLKTDFVCSLVNTSASLSNENSFEKLAHSISQSNEDYLEYKEKSTVVFQNCLGGTIFHILRGIKNDSDCSLVREYIDKKYSEYTGRLVKSVFVEKEVLKLSPGEIKKYSINIPKDFFTIEEISPQEVTSTDDIKNYIMEKHSVVLPPTLVSEIDSFIDSGLFNANTVCEFVDKCIVDVNSTGYKWKENYSNDICTAYVKNDLLLCNDDIIVKSNENRYAAFKVTDNNSFKFLGSETELSAIKSRVEQYVCNLHIKNKFKEINELFNYLYVGPTKPKIIEYYKDNFIVDYKGTIEICTFDQIRFTVALDDVHAPTEFRKEFNTIKDAKLHIDSKEKDNCTSTGIDICL